MDGCSTSFDGTTFLSVTQEYTGMRIDSFLSNRIPHYSRTFFQELIARGHVEVNNNSTIKPSFKLNGGDCVRYTIPSKPIAKPRALDNSVIIPILFEHEHFLIVNKPPFLSVHPPHTTSVEPTLTDWLVTQHDSIKHVGFLDRPGIVHRLDKNTSGMLIIARTNYAHMVFTKLFKQRTIQKTYLALVEGHPDRQGSIDFPIARDPIKKTIMTHKNPTGRASLTHFRVLHYFEKHSLVEVKPVTGRTHQIRVHMAAIGHPIVNDTSYGAQSSSCIKRHALHAAQLAFSFDDKEFSFTSDLPEDMTNLIKRIQV